MTDTRCTRRAAVMRRLLTFVLATLLLCVALAVLGFHVWRSGDVSVTVMVTVGALLFAAGFLYDHQKVVTLADALEDVASDFVRTWKGERKE